VFGEEKKLVKNAVGDLLEKNEFFEGACYIGFHF